MKGCRPLSEHEVAKVWVALGRGRMPERDRALFVVGVSTGLRVSELLNLDWVQVIAPGGWVRPDVLVARRQTKGKTSGRMVTLDGPAAQALLRWAAYARAFYAAQANGPVFCQSSGKRMGPRQAYEVLRRAFREAGLALAVPGTHTMRKTYVAEVFRRACERRAAGEAIEPLLATQELTGHASLQSLQQYLEGMGLVARGIEKEARERFLSALQAAMGGTGHAGDRFPVPCALGGGSAGHAFPHPSEPTEKGGSGRPTGAEDGLSLAVATTDGAVTPGLAGGGSGAMKLALVAQVCGVREPSVKRAVERGELRAVRIGRNWWVHDREVARWSQGLAGPGTMAGSVRPVQAPGAAGNHGVGGGSV